MTTDLAAALLRDVPRFRPDHPGVMTPDPIGVWVDHRQVLAALSRALDPAIAERDVGVPADVRDYAIDVSEAFDTMMEVERNPAGAWQALQALAGHIAALAPSAVDDSQTPNPAINAEGCGTEGKP